MKPSRMKPRHRRVRVCTYRSMYVTSSKEADCVIELLKHVYITDRQRVSMSGWTNLRQMHAKRNGAEHKQECIMHLRTQIQLHL